MTNERNDDEVLGRALSRAIETQEPHETPYERSRIALRPARRGFALWQIAGAAAALVLALAYGSWLTRPTIDPGVAASPTATASALPTAPSALFPSPAPTVAPGQLDHYLVYFARDGLPPIGAHVDNAGVGTTPADRIGTRVSHLGALAPAGAFNAMPTQNQALGINGGSSGVRVDGDLVTIDYIVPQGDWGVRGAARSLAVLQQLVYTATEEPGIRRVLITENGGKRTTIDQLIIDKPFSREDVFGYVQASREAISNGDGNTGELPTLTTQWSVDGVAPGLARFVIEVTGSAAKLPLFRVDVTPNDESIKPEAAKWRMTVTVSNGTDRATSAIVDRTPLRSVGAFPTKGPGTSVQYELGLDDLRPWRVFTLTNPTRIVVDFGGAPQAVSDRIAVYEPAPQKTIDSRISRTFTVTGAARVFEANVVWRVKDSSQKVVAQGHTTASLGTSPVWGTFSTPVTLPASVNGNVTLEVYETSAKDGSELGLVAIPLAVR